MYIGTLKKGEAYTIEFAAASTNIGSSSVGRFWIPRPGPKPILKLVAPGADVTVDQGIVPDEDALQIDVHPPQGGAGILKVTQGSIVFDAPPVAGDTQWIFDIE